MNVPRCTKDVPRKKNLINFSAGIFWYLCLEQMKARLDCSASIDIRVQCHRGTFFAAFKAAFG